MSYFKVLGLQKEPFSTSPDPNFFYQSLEHKAALTNILIEIRLRRGLSIVLGDIGTGKTTLSRKLSQLLTARKNVDFYMILDPAYDSEYLFLLALIKTFEINIDIKEATILDFKQEIKHYLFQRGVNENRTTVLLIDEAQQLNSISLEVLRTLLNYETNEFKLLQVILLGQVELLPLLIETRNLMDRVSLKYTLGPFDEEETKEMIKFRLRQAGYDGREKLFHDNVFKKIHDHANGYPRRISMLCHKALKHLVMKNKPIVDDDIIKELVDIEAKLGWQNKDLLLKKSY
ncbi:MAG: AAA family ATPase [Candidatus Orphnella occulta]|nr:AAA family ATPase [Candidatus Orphnella occulta]